MQWCRRPAVQASPPIPHDLRRTLATRVNGTRDPGRRCQALLNHRRRDVTGRHYDLYDRAREKRKALEVWSRALSSCLAFNGHIDAKYLDRLAN